ncbi:DUF4406 domain-containing protein [Aureimonas glaciei]|uniref:DUF4406 domain-containing protein n=1 Tax=Aureimonas glaciei TaxID=1776957 RepID=A0A917DE63_9HYPH|nr:DUF4406 domain-containing protein [Aureimonas glaciei]GGD30623.1 hypothetical protein GCM10011335_37100 [Aureimonas glaciei]
MGVVYLSGPMRGIEDWNYPAFHAAAAKLRAAGHRAFNPAEFPHDGAMEEFPIRQAFASYAVFICTEADTIVLLPGWEKSPGANAELSLAKICRLEVVEYEDVNSWICCDIGIPTSL